MKKPDAAKLLGVSIRTLEVFLHDGRLPSVKIGTCLRIDPRDLRTLIDSLKQSTTASDLTVDE